MKMPSYAGVLVILGLAFKYVSYTVIFAVILGLVIAVGCMVIGAILDIATSFPIVWKLSVAYLIVVGMLFLVLIAIYVNSSKFCNYVDKKAKALEPPNE